MVRIGVVTCQVLELEFAHLLSHDKDTAEIWVIRNEYSEVLTGALEKYNSKKIHIIARADEFNTRSDPDNNPNSDRGTAILVEVKQLGLHSHIPTLQSETRHSVRAMSPFVETVFLGYGLCGNAFREMDDVFRDIPIPVTMTMDQDGPVDDCVGLIIGGRENYYAEQCKCAGTMFMNAGFSKYSGDMLARDIPEKLRPKKDKIMRQLMVGYKRALLLPTPVMGEKELHENSKEFNLTYGLKVESRPGTLDLLKKGWEDAKRCARKDPVRNTMVSAHGK